MNFLFHIHNYQTKHKDQDHRQSQHRKKEPPYPHDQNVHQKVYHQILL